MVWRYDGMMVWWYDAMMVWRYDGLPRPYTPVIQGIHHIHDYTHTRILAYSYTAYTAYTQTGIHAYAQSTQRQPTLPLPTLCHTNLPLIHALIPLAYGTWHMAHLPFYCLEYGIWNLEYGVWVGSFEFWVCSLFWGLLFGLPTWTFWFVPMWSIQFRVSGSEPLSLWISECLASFGLLGLSDYVYCLSLCEPNIIRILPSVFWVSLRLWRAPPGPSSSSPGQTSSPPIVGIVDLIGDI
jgi:hypothetical protein